MPPRSAEEKAKRKLLHEQKKQARKLEKERKEREEAEKREVLAAAGDATVSHVECEASDSYCYFLTLAEDSQNEILSLLPARDLGAMSMTCRSINFGMAESRVSHLFSRLNTVVNVDQVGKLKVPAKFCENESEVRKLLDYALEGSGETGRLVTKKSKKGKKANAGDADEYIAYARFLEEAIQGHAVQKVQGQKPTVLVSKYFDEVNGKKSNHFATFICSQFD